MKNEVKKTFNVIIVVIFFLLLCVATFLFVYFHSKPLAEIMPEFGDLKVESIESYEIFLDFGTRYRYAHITDFEEITELTDKMNIMHVRRNADQHYGKTYMTVKINMTDGSSKKLVIGNGGNTVKDTNYHIVTYIKNLEWSKSSSSIIVRSTGAGKYLVSDMQPDRALTINSAEELGNFLQPLTYTEEGFAEKNDNSDEKTYIAEQYNSEYFRTKSLIALNFSYSEFDSSIEIDSATRDNGVLSLKFNFANKETALPFGKVKLFLIEINKSDLTDVSEIGIEKRNLFDVIL